jgi:hypothetical protein
MPADGELLALPSSAGWPVRKILMVPAAWCWWLPLKIFLPLPKNKLEDAVRALDLGFRVMDAAMCRSMAAHGWCILFGALRGGKNSLMPQISICLLLDLCQGSIEAAPGSPSTVVLGRQPSELVVGRPLPPPSSATVYSGRRLQVYNNLQAMMPQRRPFSFVGVSSRLHASSGSVPGGMEVGSGKLYGGGSGAGLDRVFTSQSKVLCAKCVGRIVISYFSWTLFVICITTADNEKML